MAGPQAYLAPQGRGQGWGAIGDGKRRHSISDALDQLVAAKDNRARITAAVDALCLGSDDVIVAVPDVPSFDEIWQEAMINASSARRRRAVLLWRPVAIFLDLLREGRIAPSELGASFRILVHGPNGLEDQRLTLRDYAQHPGHLAPQRNGPGKCIPTEYGIDAIFRRADEHVRRTHSHLDCSRTEPPRIGPSLITGDIIPGETRVLRTWNANWIAITAPELVTENIGIVSTEIPKAEGHVKRTYLVTPLAQPFSASLREIVERRIGPVELLMYDSVARGCLIAGRLIERGLPHYFDRLEPIAIAVMSGNEPVFEYLIPAEQVVPANQEFVSSELTGFSWRHDKKDAEFYVLKGTKEVRHWEVSKDAGPPVDTKVALRVRQTPGQSWARLSVTSSDWELLARNPVALDWKALTPIGISPDEVIERLCSPPPTIPERIVESAHIDLWMGSYWAGNGFASQYALQHARGQHIPANNWASVLRSPRRHPDDRSVRYWLVGTDGAFPEDLPDDVRAGFLSALEQMGTQLLTTTLRSPARDNSLLMALTWCYTLCPVKVQDWILDALIAEAAGRRHPLTEPARSVRVLRQGAGRAVDGKDRLSCLVAYYAGGKLNNDTINGFAMAITRREDTPFALERPQIDKQLAALGRELLNLIERRSFLLKFRNTLSAIAGLFRWRMREPYALSYSPKIGQ